MSDTRKPDHDPDALEVLATAAEVLVPDPAGASKAGASLLEGLKALEGLTRIHFLSEPSMAHVVVLQADGVTVWISHDDGGRFSIFGGTEPLPPLVIALRYNPVTKALEEAADPVPPAKRRSGVAVVLQAALNRAKQIKSPLKAGTT